MSLVPYVVEQTSRGIGGATGSSKSHLPPFPPYLATC